MSSKQEQARTGFPYKNNFYLIKEGKMKQQLRHATDEENGFVHDNYSLNNQQFYYKLPKEKWYKKVFKRIVALFKFRSASQKYFNTERSIFDQKSNETELEIEKFKVKITGKNTENNVCKNISAEDVPRMRLHSNGEKQNNFEKSTNKSDAKDLSPMINEPWKEDAQLMINGAYSRFKMMPNFSGKYKLISIIGQGSFGFVLKAERLRDNLKVAVKFIYKLNINADNWIFDCELGLIPAEVFYLKSLNHGGIIQFLDYFEEDRYVYLVTELHGTNWSWPERSFCLNGKRNPGLKMDMITGSIINNVTSDSQNDKNSSEKYYNNSNNNSNHISINCTNSNLITSPCDLFECIEAHYYLPESTIHLIFIQLLDVSAYLTSRGLVHRDLKDENVVVDANYRIKIVDFGCAAKIPYTDTANPKDEGYFERFNGTLAFAPPEVIRGLRYRGSEAESWTLGVLLYTMAFRQAPFQDSQAILYGQLEFPFDEDRPGVLDLIRKLLCKNPMHRIKLKDINKHPWVIQGPDKSTALNRSAENVLKLCGVVL